MPVIGRSTRQHVVGDSLVHTTSNTIVLDIIVTEAVLSLPNFIEKHSSVTMPIEDVIVQLADRRSIRIRQIPRKLSDYSFILPSYLSSTASQSHSPTPSANSIVYPLS